MNYDDPNGWRSDNRQNGQYQNNSDSNNRQSQQEDWQEDPYRNRRPRKGGALSTASLVLGIISLLGCFVLLYLMIPLAILGIVFAILSRGQEHRMNAKAKAGLCTSVAGLVLSIVMTAYTLVTIMPYVQSNDFQQYLEYYLDGIYGSDGDSSQNGGNDGFSGTIDDWLEQFNGNGGSGGSSNGGSSDGGSNDGGSNDGGSNDGGSNDGGSNDGGSDNGNNWYDGGGSWYDDGGSQYAPYDGGSSNNSGSDDMV